MSFCQLLKAIKVKLNKLAKDVMNISTGAAKSAIKAAIIKVGIYLLAIVLIIVAFTKTVGYASARYACHNQWVDSSINYKYTLRGGCLLELNGGWLPAKNYRVN